MSRASPGAASSRAEDSHAPCKSPSLPSLAKWIRLPTAVRHSDSATCAITPHGSTAGSGCPRDQSTPGAEFRRSAAGQGRWRSTPGWCPDRWWCGRVRPSSSRWAPAGRRCRKCWWRWRAPVEVQSQRLRPDARPMAVPAVPGPLLTRAAPVFRRRGLRGRSLTCLSAGNTPAAVGAGRWPAGASVAQR